MNREDHMSDQQENRHKERLARIGLAVNKYVLFIPLIPSLFFATSEIVAVREAGLQRTLPATLLMGGILAYPLVYVFSMVLSKKYYERQSFTKSLIISLTPLIPVLVAAIGQLLMPIKH